MNTNIEKENIPNDGKDQNINLTILNETAKAAKMGRNSIDYLSERLAILT